MGQAERVERTLGGELLPGEKVLYGVYALRMGGVRKAMVGGAAGIGGLIGAAVMAAVTEKGRAVTPAVPIRLPGRVIVALTEQRLLVFSVGGFFVGKPGKLLHSYSLDHIDWVAEPELISGVAQALRIRMGVAGEAVLGFEFPRLNVMEGKNMINQLVRSLPLKTAVEAPEA